MKRKYNQFSAEKDNMLYERYMQGGTSVSLSKEFKISPGSVLTAVRRCGGIPRTFKEINTKYTFNHSFFSKIDTEDKAYFLGLLLADGCVHRGEVIISLKETDRHIISTFVEKISGNNKIHSIKNTTNFGYSEMCRLNLRSDQMIEDLRKLEVTKNKTYNIHIPNIDNDLQRHLWRGLVDGDGYVSCYCTGKYINKKSEIKYYKKFELGLSGHLNTIESFQKFTEANKIKMSRIYKDSSIYGIRASNNKESVKLFELLYGGAASDLYLKRKFNKYQDFLK